MSRGSAISVSGKQGAGHFSKPLPCFKSLRVPFSYGIASYSHRKDLQSGFICLSAMCPLFLEGDPHGRHSSLLTYPKAAKYFPILTNFVQKS